MQIKIIYKQKSGGLITLHPSKLLIPNLIGSTKQKQLTSPYKRNIARNIE